MNENRDGLEVVRIDDGEVIHFVACEYGGRMRDKVTMGLLRNMRDDCFVRDTRDRVGDAIYAD